MRIKDSSLSKSHVRICFTDISKKKKKSAISGGVIWFYSVRCLTNITSFLVTYYLLFISQLFWNQQLSLKKLMHWDRMCISLFYKRNKNLLWRLMRHQLSKCANSSSNWNFIIFKDGDCEIYHFHSHSSNSKCLQPDILCLYIYLLLVLDITEENFSCLKRPQ